MARRAAGAGGTAGDGRQAAEKFRVAAEGAVEARLLAEGGKSLAVGDDCAAEGGRFMEPAPAMESMWRHRRAAATVRGGVALVVLLAVVGYVVRTVWPLA